MNKYFFLLAFSAIWMTAQAQTFDTTGLHSWPILTNSYESWYVGAFDSHRDTADQFDFGWGNYNMTSHIIEGDSIYILKTIGGHYMAISIDQMAGGVYTVTLSDLDGSNKVTRSFDRAPFDTRNFFQYYIDNDMVKDLEPTSVDWDIVFTRYLIQIPGFGSYPVTGVLSNRNVQVSKVEFAQNGSYSIADTALFPMSDTISTIGYDWKNSGPGGTIIYDTLAYFVKDQAGNVNELKFTNYEGQGTGKIVFTVNGSADSILLGTGNNHNVYYSLQNKALVSTQTDQGWDIAFFAQSSFNAIPVRINDVNGAELYVFPKGDISHWNTVGLDEHETTVLSVYPNPASDYIHVVTSGGALSADILDQRGRVLRSKRLNTAAGVSESRFNVSDLAPGVYFVRVAGSGFLTTGRIILSR